MRLWDKNQSTIRYIEPVIRILNAHTGEESYVNNVVEMQKKQGEGEKVTPTYINLSTKPSVKPIASSGFTLFLYENEYQWRSISASIHIIRHMRSYTTTIFCV